MAHGLSKQFVPYCEARGRFGGTWQNTPSESGWSGTLLAHYPLMVFSANTRLFQRLLISAPVPLLVALSIFYTPLELYGSFFSRCAGYLEAGGQTEQETQLALLQIRYKVASNSFPVERDLSHYKHAFPELAERLATFPSDGIWMDMGAGEARAMLSYLAELKSAVGVGQRQLLAIGASIPENNENDIRLAQREDRGRFYYIESYIEKLEFADLPKADLITDVYGPLSYSSSLSQILLRYIAQLKVGGDLFILADPSNTLIRHPEKDGLLDLLDYLRLVKGVRVVEAHDLGKGVSIHIQRTEGEIVVPAVRLKAAESTIPPQFLYEFLIK